MTAPTPSNITRTMWDGIMALISTFNFRSAPSNPHSPESLSVRATQVMCRSRGSVIRCGPGTDIPKVTILSELLVTR